MDKVLTITRLIDEEFDDIFLGVMFDVGDKHFGYIMQEDINFSVEVLIYIITEAAKSLDVKVELKTAKTRLSQDFNEEVFNEEAGEWQQLAGSLFS